MDALHAAAPRLELPGVSWAHGTKIGVAESRDEGMTWVYQGTFGLEPPGGEGSFWAPDCIRDDEGRYHLYAFQFKTAQPAYCALPDYSI